MTAAKYSTNTLSKYCKKGPPSDVIETLNGHKMESYSKVKSFDELCDALQTVTSQILVDHMDLQSRVMSGAERSVVGRGIIRCVSWQRTLQRQHAADTTLLAWCVSLIAGGLLGSKGPREVQGRKDLPPIPKGAFWCKWEEVSNRITTCVAS